jgi:GNAT superfamily N-acetyltransferase
MDQALLVERHLAEWLRAQAIVPEVEIHDDPDVTWIVHPGRAWSNCGVMLRFSEQSAAARLDTLVARYQKHGRGMGLWVSPAATPKTLPVLLRARRLNCRRNFPAMMRDLTTTRREMPLPAGLDIRTISDVEEFRRAPHPSIGPITTLHRKRSLETLRTHVTETPPRTWGFVAWHGDKPVGATLVFLGHECAGLNDVDVIEPYRGRGIGAALVDHASRHAAAQGATRIVLLATGAGERVYARCGFDEVARFGYWYRSFQRRS